MNGNRLLYFIVAAFLTGNLVFIYIKYNSDKNIDNLVAGNQKLLAEFTFSQHLRSLESNVVQLENRLHAVGNAGQTTASQLLVVPAAAVKNDLRQLQAFAASDSIDNSLDESIARLADLVQPLLQTNDAVLKLYAEKGQEAARQLLARNDVQRLAAAIVLLTQQTIIHREAQLTQVTQSIDKSVGRVQRLGTFLIVFVLASAAVLFWYIINTIRTQSRLLAQVSVSEKKAREAARVKENFLANMSHEIRTPLNAVLGFAGLLQQKKLDAESALYVQTLQRSGESLLAIVNEVLDLSKIEAGMMRIEPAPFSLRGLLHSIETMFRPKAVEKSLQFSTSIDAGLPDNLEGDATRVTQILVNLIGNALKFTQQGSVTVTAAGKDNNGSRVNVVFTIADTGIGIAPEKLPHIFNRFQQAEDSVTRKYGGTGLGLAIVRDLVQLQNGTIDVHSQPGKGTRFEVVIPCKISITEPAGTTPGNAGDNGADSNKSLHILVVEDNEVNQSLLVHFFRNWGLEFVLAQNGKVAVETLRTQTFDAVLMDIQMPEMDGYTATQIIRKELKLTLPIIAMTAHAMPGEREKCIGFGMNDYLAKPVREAELKAMLFRFVPITKTTEVAVVKPKSFQTIDLAYLKEVSGGNTAYERKVTGQFLAAVPVAIATLKTAFANGDATQLKQVAHNLRTTLSVMGLTERLSPHLDAMEENAVEGEEMQAHVNAVVETCCNAMPEAETFLDSLP